MQSINQFGNRSIDDWPFSAPQLSNVKALSAPAPSPSPALAPHKANISKVPRALQLPNHHRRHRHRLLPALLRTWLLCIFVSVSVSESDFVSVRLCICLLIRSGHAPRAGHDNCVCPVIA